MNTFQNFQAVRVNDEALADHGRAGSVRSSERTEGTGKNERRVVDVELDADESRGASLVTLPVTSLAAL